MSDQIKLGDKVTVEATGVVEMVSKLTNSIHLRTADKRIVTLPADPAVKIVRHRSVASVLNPQEGTNEDPQGRYTLEADGTSGEEPLVVLRLTDGDSSTLELNGEDLALLLSLSKDTLYHAWRERRATRPDDTKEHSDVPPDDL